MEQYLLEFEVWIPARVLSSVFARDEEHARQQADIHKGGLTPGQIVEIDRWKMRRRKLVRVELATAARARQEG